MYLRADVPFSKQNQKHLSKCSGKILFSIIPDIQRSKRLSEISFIKFSVIYNFGKGDGNSLILMARHIGLV